jgi:hypothetical protein
MSAALAQTLESDFAIIPPISHRAIPASAVYIANLAAGPVQRPATDRANEIGMFKTAM